MQTQLSFSRSVLPQAIQLRGIISEATSTATPEISENIDIADDSYVSVGFILSQLGNLLFENAPRARE